MMNEQRDRMHVLYLPRWYPHRYDPMPGLFIERHARSASAHCRVSVLYVHADSPSLPKKYELDITRDDEILQVKAYFRTGSTSFSILNRVINQFRFLTAYSKGYKVIKKDYGPAHLLHVNVLTRLGVLAMAHKFIAGTPYVITEHWTRYLPSMDNFNGYWRKMFSRWAVRHASAVMPVTDNLRKAMEKHGLRNRNWVIIPNVVDTHMFTPPDDTEPSPVKRFVHVSCFEDKQKNISGLLRTLKRLAEHRQDWECHMVGDGIHFEKLVTYAHDLGLDKKQVIFHGLKENEELACLMKNAGFQVMFSRFENLPVVILESYACGVPVLSTDVGGISEHMGNGLGILIPSEDEEALFAKLNFMLDHSGEYDREMIRQYAIDHFSKEVIGRRLYDVYRKVLD